MGIVPEKRMQPVLSIAYADRLGVRNSLSADANGFAGESGYLFNAV
jgi:hypothetical protein